MKNLIIIAAVFVLACNPSKKANGPVITESTAESKDEVEMPREMPPAQKEKTIRLVVTFASIGAGVDPNGKINLDAYINAFKEKSGKLVKYGMLAWGREGEFDCEFSLNELNLNEQPEFIRGLRKQFQGNQLIQIEENKPSRFK
ncbi:MAG: hypothetical protein ACKOX3_02510 [Bacteroidota bacterium]